MQNYRYPNIKSQNDEKYTNCRKTGYSILFIRNVLELYLCHLQLPVLPCGFSSLPSVVEKLTLMLLSFILLFLAADFVRPFGASKSYARN